MTRILCVFTVLILTSCEAMVESVAELGTSAFAAQDFEVTPPVQGGSAEIKHPDQITETDGIISAATPQDAANAAVEKLTKADGSGVSQI